VLVRYGPVRLGALSEHLRIAPRSATEVVDALRPAASSSATPTPPTGVPPWSPRPPRGEEVAAAIRSARAAEAQEFFARLAPADRAALARILDALLE
jgi:hypothetical protein